MAVVGVGALLFLAVSWEINGPFLDAEDTTQGLVVAAVEIAGPLGAGGMGEVYRGRDPGSGARWRSRCCPLPIPATQNGWGASSEGRWVETGVKL